MKKLIPWLLVAVVLQLCVYFYLDRVLLAPEAGNIITTPLTNPQNNASKLYSFDKSYWAEVSKDGVKIYSAKENKLIKQVDVGNTEKLSYFSWLQDRNIALAGISKPGTICTLEPLNMITPDAHPFNPTITGLARGAEIADVAFSPDINVVYIQVKSGNVSSIYRTDANNNLTKVSNTPAVIGRIANLKSEDALLYDSTNTGRVYLVDKNGRKQISPTDGEKYALLGTDKNDNIYIAQLVNANTGSSKTSGTKKGNSNGSSDRLAATILVGKMDTDFTPLPQAGLPYPVDKIKVSFDGKFVLQ